MNSQQSARVESDEIDLREFVDVLWRGRWTIVGLVVIAAAAMWVGGRLFLSPTYEATATLLIMPPTYQTSIEPESLALETYRDLALTTSTAAAVIEKLDLTGRDGEALDPGALLSHMEAERLGAAVEGAQQTGILELRVSWHDPEEARDIANAWANAFIQNASMMRRSESQQAARVILRQFADAEEALGAAEDRLLDFRAASHTPLVEQEVESLRAALAAQRDEALRLDRELVRKAQQLQSLDGQLAMLEEDGRWVGLLVGLPEMTAVGEGEAPGGVSGDVRARRTTIRAARQLQQDLTRLNAFEDEARIDTLISELEQERARLTRYRAELAGLEAGRARLTARESTLEEALARQEPVIVTQRSISDDALWSGLAEEGGLPPGVEELQLSDESPNPNYRYVERELIDVRTELATLPDRAASYRRLAEQGEARVRTLQAELRDLKSRRRVLQDRLAVSRALHESFKSRYMELKRRRTPLLLEVERLESQLASIRRDFARREAASRASAQELMSLRLQETRLSRDVTVTKQAYDALSGRAQAARLTELQASGDVRFVSRAVAPAAPSGPNYALNVALAVVLAAFAGVGAVLFRNFLNPTSSPERPGKPGLHEQAGRAVGAGSAGSAGGEPGPPRSPRGGAWKENPTPID